MNRAGNPFALGLLLVGAMAMGLSVFLPLDEPVSAFRVVEDNTLIQHGGWQLIVAAIAIAAAGFRVNQRDGEGWALPFVLSALAAIRIVMWAADEGLRTLYPVGPDGSVNTSHPGTVVPLGIAIYVAGVGTGAALIGSLMLRQTEKNDAAQTVAGPTARQAPTKKCPDCAETILADAKVCKHCGYRFDTSAPAAQPKKPPPTKSTKVRCHHCQHVQAVPVNQLKFDCEECGTKLKRKQPASGATPN